MNLHRRRRIILFLAWLLVSCEGYSAPTRVLSPSPASTIGTTQSPTATPRTDGVSSALPTADVRVAPLPSPAPDPRIALYEQKYDIEFLYKSCATPCRNVVGVRVLVEPLTLEEWVQKFGTPNRLIGSVRRGRTGDDIVVHLYYVSEGLHLAASRPWNGREEVTPDMVIDQFDFLAARTLPDMAAELRLLYGTSRELNESLECKGWGLVRMLGR